MQTVYDRNIVATFFMCTIFGVLTLLALTGNLLVCTAIYTTKRLRKLENLYFASLAVADLLLSLLVMLFAAANDILGFWPFGEYCKIWMSFDIMCCTASILNLCAISFDRWYHINDPMRYLEKMTSKKVGAAVAVVWISSALIAFVPWSFESNFHSALSSEMINVSNYREEITIDMCSFKLGPLYAVISSVVSFYFPCVIMIMAYTKLYRYAYKHVKSIQKQIDSTKEIVIKVIPNNNQVCILPATKKDDTNHESRKKEVSEQKARVTLGVIMGVFLICWFPFFLTNIVKALCDCIPDWLFTALTWLGYTNSTLNPIIYSIFNRDFRNAFKRIIFCQKSSLYNSKEYVVGNCHSGKCSDLSYVSNVTQNMV